MAKKTKNTPVAGLPVTPADDADIEITVEPTRLGDDVGAPVLIAGGIDAVTVEPLVVFLPPAPAPKPAKPIVPPKAAAAPPAPDVRDPLCAARRQHQRQCSCTGALRGPIR